MFTQTLMIILWFHPQGETEKTLRDFHFRKRKRTTSLLTSRHKNKMKGYYFSLKLRITLSNGRNEQKLCWHYGARSLWCCFYFYQSDAVAFIQNIFMHVNSHTCLWKLHKFPRKYWPIFVVHTAETNLQTWRYFDTFGSSVTMSLHIKKSLSLWKYCQLLRIRTSII